MDNFDPELPIYVGKICGAPLSIEILRSHNLKVIPVTTTNFSPSVSEHIARLTRAANEPGHLESVSGRSVLNSLAQPPDVTAEFSDRKLVNLSPEESAAAVRKYFPKFAKVEPTAFITSPPDSNLIVIRPLDLFTTNQGVDVVHSAFSAIGTLEQYGILKPLERTCRFGSSCTSVLSRVTLDEGYTRADVVVIGGSVLFGAALAFGTVWKTVSLPPPQDPPSPKTVALTASQVYLNQPTPYPLENNGRFYHSDPGKLVSYLGVAPPRTTINGTIEKIERKFWTGDFSAVAIVGVRGTDGHFYFLRTTPAHLDKSGFKVGESVTAEVPKGILMVTREGPPVIINPRITALDVKEADLVILPKTTAVIREVELSDGKGPWIILDCGDGVVRRMPVTTTDLDKLGESAREGKIVLEIGLTTHRVRPPGGKALTPDKKVYADTNLTSIQRN